MDKLQYPIIGAKYRHYKGEIYEVITLAIHSETGERLVIYKSIGFGGVYARPLSMWFDEVLVGNTYKKLRPRFDLIS